MGILTSVESDKPVMPPFKLRNSKLCSVSSLSHRIFKALIRLRVCAGWSEPLLVSTYHIAGNLMSGLIYLKAIGHGICLSFNIFHSENVQCQLKGP